MVLVDLSNIIYACLLNIHKNSEELELDFSRHIVLSSLRLCLMNIKRKNEITKNDIVICNDGMNNWRKKKYPEYKGNRKKTREKDVKKWDEIFSISTQLKEEFNEFLPYLVMTIDDAEADDIIASLCMNLPENKIILSSDKDFLQLQLYSKNVQQWSYNKKDYIDLQTNEYCLYSHVLKGDSSDGIPNIFSKMDFYLNEENKRQKPINKKLIGECAKNYNHPLKFCPSLESVNNFKRNRELIDLRQIPNDLQERCINKYYELKNKKTPYRFETYLIKNKMTKLLDKINDFC